jgi:hypothetical protein
MAGQQAKGGVVLEFGGAIGVVFGIVGLVFAGIGMALGIALVRRTLSRNRALAHGLTAEAQCLDVYVTRRVDGPGNRHAILGFRTVDGQDIRIEDNSGRPRVVGDFVQVRYLPHRPQDATVTGGSAAGSALGLVVGLAVSVMFVGVGLAFALGGFGMGWFGLSTSTAPSIIVPGPTTLP